MKGKACIISLHEFEVDWLDNVEGYKVDEPRLCELWDSMGLEVWIPKVDQNRCLTITVSTQNKFHTIIYLLVVGFDS